METGSKTSLGNDKLDLLQMVADNIPAIIFQFEIKQNGAFKLIYVCDQLRQVFNISMDEAIKQPERILALIHDEDFPRMWDSVQNLVRRKKMIREECRIRVPKGEMHWYRIHAMALSDDGGISIWNGLAVDISEDKHKEEMLQKVRGELEASNKMLEQKVKNRTAELESTNLELERSIEELFRKNKELEEFAFVASHDLQEPMRKVQIFSNLLVKRYADKINEKGKDYIKRLQSAADRTQEMIKSLLDYSRVTTTAESLQKVDLNRTLKKILSTLEPLIENSGGEIAVENLPSLVAEPNQMERLFQNLIANALKYRHPDRPPRVTISAEKYVAKIGNKPENWAKFMVQDNGIGFEDRFRERVFAPFQRLHSREEYEGEGMGLAICYKIVERHRGEITAESTPGIGSRFIFRLPVE